MRLLEFADPLRFILQVCELNWPPAGHLSNNSSVALIPAALSALLSWAKFVQRMFYEKKD